MFYIWLIPLLIILAIVFVWVFGSRRVGSGKREDGKVLRDD